MTVTFENNVPVVDLIAITPLVAYTNDIIQASLLISDPDSEQQSLLTAEYEWHVIDADTNQDEYYGYKCSKSQWCITGQFL